MKNRWKIKKLSFAKRHVIYNLMILPHSFVFGIPIRAPRKATFPFFLGSLSWKLSSRFEWWASTGLTHQMRACVVTWTICSHSNDYRATPKKKQKTKSTTKSIKDNKIKIVGKSRKIRIIHSFSARNVLPAYSSFQIFIVETSTFRHTDPSRHLTSIYSRRTPSLPNDQSTPFGFYLLQSLFCYF